MKTQGAGFWSKNADYKSMVAAFNGIDGGTLWGDEGALAGKGVEALMDEIDEDDDDALYLRLRTVFTAEPASAYVDYRLSHAGYFIRELDDGSLVYAESRDAETWWPVEEDGATGQDGTTGKDEPRRYSRKLDRYLDETLGWTALDELPAGEREPRVGDFYDAGGGWSPVTRTEIDAYRERVQESESSASVRYFDHSLTRAWDQDAEEYVAATERPPRPGVDRRFLADGSTTETVTSDMVADSRRRYFSVGWTKVYSRVTGEWKQTPATLSPAVGDLRSASVAEPLSFVPVTAQMLDERARLARERKDAAKKVLKDSIATGKVKIQLGWPGDTVAEWVTQAQTIELLDACGLQGAVAFEKVKAECADRDGSFTETYVNADGFVFALSLLTELVLIDTTDASGADLTTYQARVGWRLSAAITDQFVAGVNKKVIAGLGKDTRVDYLKFGELVIFDDHTVAELAWVRTAVRLFAKKTGRSAVTGTVRRTTQLRRAAVKVSGDKADLIRALTAAGWKGVIASEG